MNNGPNGPIVIVPKYHRMGEGFSRAEKAEADIHPGRNRRTQSAASWICDLTDLQKCIVLCSYCRQYFNPRKHRYRKFYQPDYTGKTDGYRVNGKCYACKQQTGNTPGGGTAFVHETLYNRVCIDPGDARRRARVASRQAMSVWQFINHNRRK